ncbi:hypothetical protein FOC4_g10000691 [Fusarium odoratissimum]|uniref:Uncharacterized protein n=2 Tax=Fusarium oxysporum species complex TaxID=171631 RepID=N1RUM3_FUSC4|nr:hypothetical protein FOC4_g10000691 [Fusarium odoratissimum]TXC07764.1 hypothetical protein FocTR4_00004319 [Fusarium oxysporum f. sp. cubense]
MSLILMLIKSSRHRCRGAENESRWTLVQNSRYVRDTCHLLTTLQTYWHPFGPMISHGEP